MAKITKDLLTIKEFATLVGVSTQYIGQLIKKGILKLYKDTNQLYKPENLEQWRIYNDSSKTGTKRKGKAKKEYNDFVDEKTKEHSDDDPDNPFRQTAEKARTKKLKYDVKILKKNLEKLEKEIEEYKVEVEEYSNLFKILVLAYGKISGYFAENISVVLFDHLKNNIPESIQSKLNKNISKKIIQDLLTPFFLKESENAYKNLENNISKKKKLNFDYSIESVKYENIDMENIVSLKIEKDKLNGSIKKIEYGLLSGNLIYKSDIKQKYYPVIRTSRDEILNIPTRSAAIVTAKIFELLIGQFKDNEQGLKELNFQEIEHDIFVILSKVCNKICADLIKHKKNSDKHWLLNFCIDAHFPDPTLTVSEWADEFRVLSSVASAEAGRWRTSRTPYLREIMDCLSANSKFEKIVFIKGAQVGGTECGNNWIGYIIDKVPGPTMLVQPTGDMAKDNSKTRIDPLIEETPTLRAKVREARAKDSGNAMLMKEFPGGFLGMTGANSPATLRSKPIKNLFLDEVDSYPGDIGGEGDPTQLAIVRTRTFSRRKILMVSTPTIYGRSRIQAAYNDSDSRRFHVPCPHCSKYQPLEWDRIKFDTNKPDTAHYVCNGCGEKIYNHEKEFMLPRGKWVAENPNSKIAGFHISSLYSPVGWYSWANAAQDFINAKQDVKLLKVFVNTVLGECWEEKGDAPEWEKLYFRREKYERNTVPMRALFLTAGVDIQKDRIECEIVGWCRGKESFSIDYRVFPGDTSNPTNEPFKRLDSMLNETFLHEGGASLQIRGLCVDSGYNAQVVYNWVRKYTISRVQAVKGQDSISAMVGIAKPVDIVETGSNRKIYRGVKVFNLGVGIIKSELYAWLKQTPPEANQSYPAGYCHFPESYEEEFFKQLTSETLTQRGKRFEWKKGRERNEALDCRVYARAAAAILGIDRFNDLHWSRIEEMILNTKPAPPPPTAQRKKQLSSGVQL